MAPVKPIKGKPAGPNVIAIANLIIDLHNFPRTAKQLADRSGIAIQTVYKWLRTFKRKGVIYIDSWTYIGTNLVAKWFWGNESDAPRPPKKTDRKDYYRVWRFKNSEKLKKKRKQYIERKRNEQRKESSSNLSR